MIGRLRKYVSICIVCRVFLLLKVSRPDVLPPHPPTQKSLEVSSSRREVNNHHQTPKCGMRGAVPPLPLAPSWCDVHLRTGSNFPLLYVCKILTENYNLRKWLLSNTHSSDCACSRFVYCVFFSAILRAALPRDFPMDCRLSVRHAATK